MRRLTDRALQGIGPGLAVAALGALLLALPVGEALERDAGLALLYALRGERAPPQSVCIVAIDARAAAALGLPPNPKEWPRRLHAELLDFLVREGARVVVFDLLFASPREPTDDRLLAEAIARAGNVLLAAQLERDTEPVRNNAHKLVHERYVAPMPQLAQAALGAAPAVLPKSARIDLFWAFKEEGFETPGLAAVALQAFAREGYPALRGRLDPRPDLPQTLGAQPLERTVLALRQAFRDGPGTAPAQPPPADDLARLIALYSGPAVRTLNFYGGPARITTHPYDRVLAAARGEPAVPPGTFAGKVVFVGLAEMAQTRQRDNYHTVYTRDDGVDLSGVEIGTTAVANLIDGSSLRGPGGAGLMALLAGMFALGFATRLLPIGGAAAAVLGAGAAYLLFARSQFAGAWVHWPVAGPLGLQLPAALALGLVLQYREVRRERDTIRRLLGVPAPNHALDELARNLGPLPNREGLVFSTCLIGDVEGYTKISEQLGPSALLQLMNRYFETIFPPIQRNRGVVIDNIGDAMQAVWLSRDSDPGLRSLALQAGADMQEALRQFNTLDDHPPMNVRLGLHCGEVAFGPWGAAGRVENRIVGDIVNTAARIQALNKDMGTRLLASGPTLARLPQWLARPVGRFRLVGRQATLEVFQPLGLAAQASDELRWLCEQSTQAMAAFTAGDFELARARWETVLARNPDDGPGRYHVALCAKLQAAPPADWDGVIGQTRK
jgi:adenylate cyclase